LSLISIRILWYLCTSTPSITLFFFFKGSATSQIYTLSLHDALPILFRFPNGHSGIGHGDVCQGEQARKLNGAHSSLVGNLHRDLDRKSTRLNSSHVAISYAVFCLKKKHKSKHESHGLYLGHSHC